MGRKLWRNREFETVTTEALHNGVYDSSDDIPQEFEEEGAQVYTRDEGLVVFESE